MKFIPDEEIVLLDNQDLLGTKIYTDSLKEIIDQNKNINKPLTIGLFGGWGTGKSSIIKTLQCEFEKSTDIKVLNYNAWKYSEDAFRRSFILDLIQKFKLKDKTPFNNMENVLYNTKNEDVEHKIKFSKKGWVNILFFLPLVTFYIWWTSYETDMKVLISIFGIITTIITYLIKESISEYKISISSPRIFSPEQFSDNFKAILDNIVVKPTKKLIIIIDNVDRCDKVIAKEIMLTVKNFLDQNNCIFIIPIDDEAIKNLLGFRNDEGEEYLRKFFNINIRIKKFTSIDLFKYTKQLIEKHELGFSDKIADIVSKVYSKNPRRIIQFLNNLHADKIVAENQERSGYIPSDSVTKNLEFLSKVSILKEECPEIYSEIVKMPSILKRIENFIQDNKYEYDFNQNKYSVKEKEKEINKMIRLSEDEYKFLKLTAAINTKNIDNFIRIKNHPTGISQNTQESLTTQSWEKTKELIISEQDSVDNILEFLRRKTHEDIDENGLLITSGLNDINTFLEIYNDEDYNEHKSQIRYILHPYINNDTTKEIVRNLNSINLISIAKDYYEIEKEEFLINIIVISIKEDNIENISLTKLFIENFRDYSSILEKIKPEFSKYLINKNDGFEYFKDVIITKEQLKILIQENVIDNVISKIENKQDETEIIRLNFIKSLNELNVLEESQINEYVTKINAGIATNEYALLNFWFNKLDGFVNKLNENSSSIIQLYTRLTDRFNDGLMDNFYADPENVSKLNSNKYFISFMKDIYVRSNAAIDGLNFIIKYLKRFESAELNFYVLNCLSETVDEIEFNSYPFANEVQMLFEKVEYQIKVKILELLNKILLKTKTENEEYIGLKLPEIQNIFSIYLIEYLKQDTEISGILKSSLIEFSKSEILKPILYDLIKVNFKDIDKIEIINVLEEFDDRVILETFANNIIVETRSEKELKDILLFLGKNSFDKYEIFKNKIFNLANITENDNFGKIFIKVIFEDNNIFNDIDKNNLTYRLLHFATGSKSEVKFALDMYSKIGKLNNENKNQLKNNIKSINTYGDKDLELQKNQLEKTLEF